MRIQNLKVFKERRVILRRKQTKEESKVWEVLRRKNQGFKIKRQQSIGVYIVDFYCSKKKLVIEIDGQQHKSNIEYDEERTKYFNSLEIRVIRFWNKDVNENFKYVIDLIYSELSK